MCASGDGVPQSTGKCRQNWGLRVPESATGALNRRLPTPHIWSGLLGGSHRHSALPPINDRQRERCLTLPARPSPVRPHSGSPPERPWTSALSHPRHHQHAVNARDARPHTHGTHAPQTHLRRSQGICQQHIAYRLGGVRPRDTRPQAAYESTAHVLQHPTRFLQRGWRDNERGRQPGQRARNCLGERSAKERCHTRDTPWAASSGTHRGRTRERYARLGAAAAPRATRRSAAGGLRSTAACGWAPRRAPHALRAHPFPHTRSFAGPIHTVRPMPAHAHRRPARATPGQHAQPGVSTRSIDARSAGAGALSRRCRPGPGCPAHAAVRTAAGGRRGPAP